jgi:hypothetical protein
MAGRAATVVTKTPRRARRARKAAPRRTRKAPTLVLVRSVSKRAAERAYRRVVERAWAYGESENWQHGWITRAAGKLGLSPTLMASILRGDYGERLGLTVIERVALKLHITIGSLCD